MTEAMTLARDLAQFAPIAMKQNKQYARRRTESDFRACADSARARITRRSRRETPSAGWRRFSPKQR
jgi:enoyl-CoA hydratase/carnithine racemase